jgi:uncharacterized membrane protein
MSSAYLWLKWLHIVSSTVLFGTGAGIAYFFLRAQRTGDVRIIAAVARDVVFADAIFTASAVVIQPVTGFLLLWLGGYPFSLPWVWISMVLYLAIGCCWLPVVWLQTRMRDLAIAAANTGSELPPAYFRHYRRWCALGWPAFAGVLVIFWLMVARPVL